VDGEISGLVFAALAVFVAIVALTGFMSSLSISYNVSTTADVQNLITTANTSTQNIASFVNSSSGQITQNDYGGGVSFLWLTSGALTTIANIITSLPSVLYALFVAFVNAISIPLGISPALSGLVVSIVYTAVLATFLFAVLYALIKVKL